MTDPKATLLKLNHILNIHFCEMLQQQPVDENVTLTHFLQEDALSSVIEEPDIIWLRWSRGGDYRHIWLRVPGEC